MLRATEEYRAAEDVLGKFLASECQFAEGQKATASSLNDALATWCRAEGIGVPSPQKLASRLRRIGLGPPVPSNGARWWNGIGLVRQP